MSVLVLILGLVLGFGLRLGSGLILGLVIRLDISSSVVRWLSDGRSAGVPARVATSQAKRTGPRERQQMERRGEVESFRKH